MGAFTMSNAKGLVAPGATATMVLRFNAEGSELYRAPIRINVSGRSKANVTGKSFEIVGESVVPGIETRSFGAFVFFVFVLFVFCLFGPMYRPID